MLGMTKSLTVRHTSAKHVSPAACATDTYVYSPAGVMWEKFIITPHGYLRSFQSVQTPVSFAGDVHV